MQTLILEQPGSFRLTRTPPPAAPGPGEALVRVRRVGICGTDLHAYRGRQPFFTYPRILGHELGVEVVALGDGATASGGLPLTVGALCAVEPYLNCGRCSACRRGRTNCCLSLQVLGVHTDGGMRELISVPAAKLHPSPTLALEQLALVEMLCIGAHAVGRAHLEPGEPVLVVGAGPIGLAVARFAQLAGAEVTMMELSEWRLEFCRRHLGITRQVDGRGDPQAELRAIYGDQLPTSVFDATGSARSMMNAFRYGDQGSKLVFVGLVQDDITFHDPDFHRREMTLLSSRNATGADFRWAIEMLEAGRIDLAPWITHRADPRELPTAFPDWLRPDTGVVKAMLTIEAEG